MELLKMQRNYKQKLEITEKACHSGCLLTKTRFQQFGSENQNCRKPKPLIQKKHTRTEKQLQ